MAEGDGSSKIPASRLLAELMKLIRELGMVDVLRILRREFEGWINTEVFYSSNISVAGKFLVPSVLVELRTSPKSNPAERPTALAMARMRS